ncbi:MAG: membrane protein insertase YidC [Cytophagales bacterium]|nr:membrane protein insertase YidC [Cytophagales bacterium]
MNDIRRTILWVVFGFSMVLLWDQWQISNGHPATFFPQAPKATSASGAAIAPAALPAASSAAQTNNDVPTSTALSTAATSTAAAANLPPAPSGAAATPARELIEVTTDVYKLGFDAEGGTLVRAELLKQRDIVNKDINMVLLDQSKDRLYSAQTGLIGAAAGVPNHKTVMTLATPERALKDGADSLTLRFEAVGGDVKLAKTYVLRRGAYDMDVTHEVTNMGAAETRPQLYVQLIRDGNKPAGESSFYSTFTGPVIYTDAKKYQKVEFSDIEKNKADFEKLGTNGYVGMVQHYFVSSWIATDGAQHENFIRKTDTNLYAVGMILPLKPLAAGQTQKLDTKLYVGPQEEKRLESLAPGLELVKDYGYFTILSKPLFWVIDELYKMIGNWGWAIVAVVVLLKIVFYWFNAKAYQSMGKMKAINPKIMEMRERLKDKPQQMQQEMMRIYREEKVNPMGGCLPIIIQIPVFIALYWVLLSSVEFRGAPWILWIKDLSAPDPFFILPVLMTLSSLLQTWLNPTPPDPMQAKMMWIMPLMFSFMFFFFPAGLVLYWLVNNILSIAQQWVINKRLGVN